jgi:predicted ATP-grasp superfamily ATP-dependent carboligase
MHAIVLDGQLKSALTIVRSLGAGGVTVSAGATRKTAMSLHSKYAQRQFLYPSPYEDQRAFIDAVRAEAMQLGGKPVVYACSDATFLSLYAFRHELEDVVTLIYPEETSVEIAFDKAATYSLARVSSVPTITTYTPETKDELRQTAESIAYPAVLKTRRSVTWRGGKGIFGTARFMHNAGELEAAFLTLKDQVGETPLIQDFVRGEEYGVEMLAKKGVVYARVAHHRLRSLTPTGGASVLKETVDEGNLRHALVSYAEILVKKLSWTGPIMVEFKVDEDTREPYLMEINGRFWGSLPLTVFAGADMPLLYHTACTKKVLPDRVMEGREGVQSIHFLGDVQHLLRVLFAWDDMRKVLYPKRMRALRDFLILPRGVKNDVWSLRDPKPSLIEIVDVIASKLEKRKKKKVYY